MRCNPIHQQDRSDKKYAALVLGDPPVGCVPTVGRETTTAWGSGASTTSKTAVTTSMPPWCAALSIYLLVGLLVWSGQQRLQVTSCMTGAPPAHPLLDLSRPPSDGCTNCPLKDMVPAAHA